MFAHAFTWSCRDGLQGEGLDVVDGGDRGGLAPRHAEDGAEDDHDGNDEQVQMVPAAFLQTTTTTLATARLLTTI